MDMKTITPKRGEPFHLICPNKGTLWRADTFWTKEPITLEWLDAMGEGDVLLDAGANVGLYSLYAAAQGHDVMAFEPESQNYSLLCANIYHNKLSDRIKAYAVALGDESRIASLNLSQWGLGGSCHTFGKEESFSGKEMKPAFKQGCFQFPIRLFCQLSSGVPTHCKIDVDGNEPMVVQGARNFQDVNWKSLIIEVNWNRDDHKVMVEELGQEGWAFDASQAMAAKRIEGPFQNVGETVFYRG